ncbi:50S ribosomal protein L9 [bacterium]|nr:50S ribosomal protein L9 [bacterium]
MRVLLKENIESLGSRGDIVEVADGYGRNYLLPKNLAFKVTKSNMKRVEMEQKALRKSFEEEKESYQDLIQNLNQTTLSFTRKTAEKDVIFGSVSSTDIKEALDKKGFDIDKKKILLEEPIKRLGNYTVPVKVFHEDKSEVKVQVLGEKTEEEQQEGKEESPEEGEKKEEE